ncbi:uncharacterized protein LOC127718334 [Mytilus californianus]|uniref:uncharacterized protein LOC127718334 n=1 Tax=Mytilus californianus TaxID=6549 RepID=UPI002247D304|nr:uncharacterized protein LOC127718334 [Mytilus californianus]
MCSCKCIIVTVIVLVVIITLIAVVATSLKKLASDEIGIKYDTILKKLENTTEREGLHTGLPGFKFIKFPSVYTSLTFNHLESLNKDGVKIVLYVSYQYKVRSDKLRDIILEFRDKDGYTKFLRYEGESAIHESCSYFNTSQFAAERANFQEKVKDQIMVRYKKVNAEITDLQVNNIARPTEYESAIRSKEKAREDIRVANNERPRLLTEAETQKREAETNAKIIIDKAESDTRILANRAVTEAQSIIAQYKKEAEAYKKIVEASGLGFTIDGFISYLGVRVIADAKNLVYIGLDSPAKTVYP